MSNLHGCSLSVQQAQLHFIGLTAVPYAAQVDIFPLLPAVNPHDLHWGGGHMHSAEALDVSHVISFFFFKDVIRDD